MKKLQTKFWTLMLASTVATVALANTASAQDASDWLAKERFQFRVRALDVIADGGGHVTQNAALGTDVDNAITPEFDITYYFTDNISAELIAATSKHTITAGTNTLGDAWILPPTLTLQYHFTPDEAFSPYIGAGLNYSMFYGEDDAAGFNGLDVDGGVGYALQAGFDYWLNDNWGVNLDVKYINLDVDVDVNLGATHLDADNVGLDPVIVGAGVSYRF